MKMTWQEKYKVHSYEIDMSSNATFTSLCNFLQESAWNHAKHLGLGFSHLIERNLVWILARQHIAVNKYPKWGDEIIVHTWPSGNDRMFCYRDFKVEDKQGNIIIQATTTWFVIDINSRRPQRTESYIDLKPENPEHAFESNASKLPPIEHHEAVTSHPVVFTDLDVNGHVNNIKYLDYIIDSLAFDYVKDHQLTDLEINYLNEAVQNDTVQIINEFLENGVMYHSLKRGSDQNELCRAKTCWKKIK